MTSIYNQNKMDLFRRAFAGDEEAWTVLQIRYTPLIRHWVGFQQQVEFEDVMQEAWIAFYRYAPLHPSLVCDDTPERVLAYLRTCVKTAVISLNRRERRYAFMQRLECTDAAPLPYDNHTNVLLRIVIGNCVQRCLLTDEERLAFHLRLVCDIKPRDIAAMHPLQFTDVEHVYTVIQRIIRRLRADPTLQSLRSSLLSECSEEVVSP